ncbi:hypothetical protein [Fulvivirga ligni]|uniref:hypothetical protein n=1 Tax=Fulvivirga ligni TaxID=2904246 RepID=UPI001F301ABC|nr:hypothetical protein [Fulvivirga ligni]UII23273.1 hypothetical protein LVD16_08535 [Fulvivirga ligni]
MKKLTFLLSAGILFMLLATIGCGSDDGGPTEEEQQTAKLIGVWTATTVNDGTVRDDYDDFTITFTQSTYSTTGGPEGDKALPFQNSGSWSLGTPVTSSISLSSQPMTYGIVDDVLTITFTYNGDGFPGNAKTANVNGDWTFVFEKN